MCVGMCVWVCVCVVTNIDRQLKAIEAQRACIEELWQSAVGLLENEKVVSVYGGGGCGLVSTHMSSCLVDLKTAGHQWTCET